MTQLLTLTTTQKFPLYQDPEAGLPEDHLALQRLTKEPGEDHLALQRLTKEPGEDDLAEEGEDEEAAEPAEVMMEDIVKVMNEIR